jgi:hypothetical protein
MDPLYHNTLQICILFANKMMQTPLTEYEVQFYEQAARFCKHYLQNQDRLLSIQELDFLRKEKEVQLDFFKYMKENPISEEFKDQE